MRIIQLIPSLDVGGAERVAALLARELARAGHEVAVVSLAAPVGSWIEADLRDAGVDVRFLGKRPGLDARVIPRLGRALAELRPDVLHTHLHTLKYALPARAAWRRCAVVHTLHNVADREAAPHDKLVQRAAFRAGVAPVAIGDAVAESLRRVYRVAPRRTIPNGIPTADYRPAPGAREETRAELGISPDTFAFLAVGRLNPQKNHAALLRALADPGLRGRDALLLIAGEGELRSDLERQIAELGLQGRARLLGVRADVPRLLAAADAFVLPSTWEGNPLAVMEALAAGLPVAAAAVGCVPELVPPAAGRLVPAGDVPALSAALAALAADPAAARAMGAAGAELARTRFDAAVMARGYAALFADLLHPSGETRTR